MPTVPQVALAADGLPSPESFARRDDATPLAPELLKIAGITEELLDQLEQFGLIGRRPGTRHYDTDGLVVARTARELADFGLEPRHLRAFQTAADREVGLVEQVVAPHARGRDAAARARADEAAARDRGAVRAPARDAGQARACARAESRARGPRRPRAPGRGPDPSPAE